MPVKKTGASPTKKVTLSEVYDMSQEALDTARSAQSDTRIHVAVCEAQNKDILRRLSNQDKILYGVAAGVGMEILNIIASHLMK